MTEAKSSKRSRRAEQRDQGAEPEKGSRPSPSDSVADSSSDTSERAPSRRDASGGSSTQVIRDRNLRLREQAAAQRRSKREREQRRVPASGLDAGERVDDALARSTHAVMVWLKRHFNTVQWVVVLLIVAGVGWQIYSWRSKRVRARNADVLAEGLMAEVGQVKGKTLEGLEEEDKGYPNTLPSFPDDEARLRAAATEYKQAIALTPESGPGRLAEIGLASVLFQQGKFDDALARYRAVAAGPLAKNDPNVRGRALEGTGLSLESKSDFDGALRHFGRLASMDEPGFEALGLYHEARVYFLKGDKTKAKEKLGKAQAKLKKLVKDDEEQRSYLAGALRELATAIDPASAAAGFSAEEVETLQRQIMNDPEKLQRLLENIKRGVMPKNGPALPEPQEAPNKPSEPSSEPAPAETAPKPKPAPGPAPGRAAAPRPETSGQGTTPPKAPSTPPSTAPTPASAPATGSENGSEP